MTGAYIPVIYDAFIPIASTAITEPESLPPTQCSPSAGSSNLPHLTHLHVQERAHLDGRLLSGLIAHLLETATAA